MEYKAIIVDDEEDIRYLLRHLLEKGRLCCRGRSRRRRRLALPELCPDMVLADIRCPG